MMNGMQELRGERVVLRPVVDDDRAALRRMRAEPEVARWWGPAEEGWPGTEEDVVLLAIVVDGEPAGLVQFWEEPDEDARHADVDIFVTSRLHDRGIGTEAFALICEHLVAERGHHRLTLGTAPDNARAIHVYETLGFRRVGITEASARDPATGEWRDELLMERVVKPQRSATAP